MPIHIDRALCDGCGGSLNPPCVRLCPGDILAADPEGVKPRVRDGGECWSCYACAKACPRRAIEVHLPYQIAPHTASLRPEPLPPDRIRWVATAPDGTVEEFVLPTRALAVEIDEPEERELHPPVERSRDSSGL